MCAPGMGDDYKMKVRYGHYRVVAKPVKRHIVNPWAE